MELNKYLVVSLPRSGSTWLTAWLNSAQDSKWIHDPLAQCKIDELEEYYESNNLTGCCCTGSWMYPEIINKSNLKKVILLRNLEDINISLEVSGFDRLSENSLNKLLSIKYENIILFEELFDSELAKNVWYMFNEEPFNEDIHKAFASRNIQEDPKSFKINREVLEYNLSFI